MARRNRIHASSVAQAIIAVGLIGGLFAINWHLLNKSIDTTPLSHQALDSPARASGDVEIGAEAPKAATVHNYPQTVSRPLFFPDRRPPKRERAVKTEPTRKKKTRKAHALPAGLRLVGIVERPDRGSRLALVRSKAMPNGTWVEEGHVLEGWRVGKVARSSVTIRTGGQSRELMLFPAPEHSGQTSVIADE